MSVSFCDEQTLRSDCRSKLNLIVVPRKRVSGSNHRSTRLAPHSTSILRSKQLIIAAIIDWRALDPNNRRRTGRIGVLELDLASLADQQVLSSRMRSSRLTTEELGPHLCPAACVIICTLIKKKTWFRRTNTGASGIRHQGNSPLMASSSRQSARISLSSARDSFVVNSEYFPAKT